MRKQIRRQSPATWIHQRQQFVMCSAVVIKLREFGKHVFCIINMPQNEGACEGVNTRSQPSITSTKNYEQNKTQNQQRLHELHISHVL